MMRLLVLDDDVATGRLVTRIAGGGGWEAAATATVEAFHAECRTATPDVVVLDLQLGDADGVEQLRLLSGQRFSGSLILMSGFDKRVLGTTSELARNLGLSVAAALPKPLNVPELRQVLQSIRARAEPPSLPRVMDAIRAGELVLEYQPIVARETRALCKLEALVRWQHPQQGLLGPDRFVPLAESDRDAINALTDWVVAAAVRDYKWLETVGAAVPIAVNVSARNLRDLAFPDRVGRLLRDAGMPPDQLCFEITETAAFHDATESMDILSRIRLKGIQLAIDDFGTGYSSLKLLRQMPFSTLKIDRSFIADLPGSSDGCAITQCIIDLADNMDLETIAEGVETEAIARTLEEMGVDCLQGYSIARSMPVGQLPAWAEQWGGRIVKDLPCVVEAGPAGDNAGLNGAGRPIAAADDMACGASNAGEDRSQSGPRLTPRQTAVMQLLAEGCSVKTIARRLELSIGTVKTHLSQAYAALGAHNRIEALRSAGLVLARPEPERREIC